MGSIVIVAFSPDVFAARAPVRNACAGVKIGNGIARVLTAPQTDCA
jgi:hypothetical protein